MYFFSPRYNSFLVVIQNQFYHQYPFTQTYPLLLFLIVTKSLPQPPFSTQKLIAPFISFFVTKPLVKPLLPPRPPPPPPSPQRPQRCMDRTVNCRRRWRRTSSTTIISIPSMGEPRGKCGPHESEQV